MSDTHLVKFRTFETGWVADGRASSFKVAAQTEWDAFVVAMITIHIVSSRD
jgi:hypothetical protein